MKCNAFEYEKIEKLMEIIERVKSWLTEEEEPEEKPVTKIERATAILEELLADGSMPVSGINEIMAEEGIGEKTAQRARAM